MQMLEVPPSESHSVCSMHEPLVGAAIAQSCRYVAILTGSKWAVFRAIMWHPTLLVPTLFSLVHTGSIVDTPNNPGVLPQVLPGPLAGALFPPVDTSILQNAASGAHTPFATTRMHLHDSHASSTHDNAAPASPTMAHVSLHSPRTHDSSSHSSTLSLVLWDVSGAAAVVDVHNVEARTATSAAALQSSPPEASVSALHRSGNLPEDSGEDAEVVVATIAPLVEAVGTATEDKLEPLEASRGLVRGYKGYGVPQFGVSRECGLVRMMAASNNACVRRVARGVADAPSTHVMDSAALADITNFSAFAEQDVATSIPCHKGRGAAAGAVTDHRWDTHVATATLATLPSARIRADSARLNSARLPSSRSLSITHEASPFGPIAVSSGTLPQVATSHAVDMPMRSSCLACVFTASKQHASPMPTHLICGSPAASAVENSALHSSADPAPPVVTHVDTIQQFQSVFTSTEANTQELLAAAGSPLTALHEASPIGTPMAACMGSMHGPANPPSAQTTACAMLSTTATMPPCIAVGRSDGSILMRPLMFAALRSERHERAQMHGCEKHSMHAPMDDDRVGVTPCDLGHPRSHRSFQMNCHGLGSNPMSSPDWITAATSCIRVMHGHRRKITVLCEADFERSIITVAYPSPEVSTELPIPEHSVATGEMAFEAESSMYVMGRTSPPPAPLVTHVQSAPNVGASASGTSMKDDTMHDRHARVRTVSRSTTARRLALARGLQDRQSSLGGGLGSLNSAGLGLQSSSLGSGGAAQDLAAGDSSLTFQRDQGLTQEDRVMHNSRALSSPGRGGGGGGGSGPLNKGLAAFTSFFTGGVKQARNNLSFSRRNSGGSGRLKTSAAASPHARSPPHPETSRSFAHSSSSVTLNGMQPPSSPEHPASGAGPSSGPQPRRPTPPPQLEVPASAVSEVPSLAAGPSTTSAYSGGAHHRMLAQQSMTGQHPVHM